MAIEYLEEGKLRRGNRQVFLLKKNQQIERELDLDMASRVACGLTDNPKDLKMTTMQHIQIFNWQQWAYVEDIYNVDKLPEVYPCSYKVVRLYQLCSCLGKFEDRDGIDSQPKSTPKGQPY